MTKMPPPPHKRIGYWPNNFSKILHCAKHAHIQLNILMLTVNNIFGTKKNIIKQFLHIYDLFLTEYTF